MSTAGFVYIVFIVVCLFLGGFFSGCKRGPRKYRRQRLQGSTSKFPHNIYYLVLQFGFFGDVLIPLIYLISFLIPCCSQGDPGYGYYSKGAKGERGQGGSEVRHTHISKQKGCTTSFCMATSKTLAIALYERWSAGGSDAAVSSLRSALLKQGKELLLVFSLHIIFLKHISRTV